MELPPGEPVAITNAPVSSTTMVGDMDERGRLPASTRLAAWRPWASTGARAKSVSSLLSIMPPAIRPDPKGASTVAVMETTSPAASTITKWVVPGASAVVSRPTLSGAGPAGSNAQGSPAVTVSRAAPWASMSAARWAR